MEVGKLMLEPIAYFKYQGVQMGMTAHEAAMYDQIQSGDLRSKMVSLSRQESTSCYVFRKD